MALEEIHRAGVVVTQNEDTREIVFRPNGIEDEFRVQAPSGAEAVAAFRRWLKLRDEA